MFGSSNHWQITATEDYIDQVCKLSLPIQNNIQNKWIEVAKQKNPLKIGSWDSCGKILEDCPYVVVIFAGLTFEFTYKIDNKESKITLLDCLELDIFHPN